MKPLIVFTGPLYSRSGYGECARDFAKYLLTKSNTHDIQFINTKWGNTPNNALNENTELADILESKMLFEQPSNEIDIHFHMSLPNEFRLMGKVNIGLTASIETTKCPPAYIQGCNRMDLIIVPSEFTKKTILQTEHIDKRQNTLLQCTTPVKVVFEGYDETIYNTPTPPPSPLSEDLGSIPDTFCFLFVGHWMTQHTLGNDRKNIGMLIKTFLETFSNEKKPPSLILKTSGTNFSYIDKEHIIKKINDIQDMVSIKGSTPNIYLLHGELTPLEMRQLYEHTSVKCHITFTHGEGFCRPLLEAALSCKPILAPKWSGHLDFLNYKHSILLPGKLEPINPTLYNNNYVTGAEWFVVDYQHASNMLREVYTNYDKHHQRAEKVKKYISEKYTTNKMHEEYDSALESVMKVE